MTMTLTLSEDADLIHTTFAEWHGILKAGGTEFGSALQIGGTDVRFRPIKRHHPKLHLDFWIGSSESAAVQLNQPKKAGSENPGSTIALDVKGRRYLIRQGDLHGNRQSERINGTDFVQRTKLERVAIQGSRSSVGKQWFIVCRLDGAGHDAVRKSTAEFVRQCWNARTYGQRTVDDQERLRALFGNPERGGWYDVEPPNTPKRMLLVQGYVSEQLTKLLETEGIEIRKPRHAANYEVDGVIDTTDRHILLEIKTGISAADVYGGLGQLTLYPILLPDLVDHARILLLPGDPGEPLVEALTSCDVELHRYQLKRGRSYAKACFSAAFLRRCGMSKGAVNDLVKKGMVLF